MGRPRLKVGDAVKVLVDVQTLWAELPTIPKGTRGTLVKILPDDDSALYCDLMLESGVRRVTFFENEIGVLIDVLP